MCDAFAECEAPRQAGAYESGGKPPHSTRRAERSGLRNWDVGAISKLRKQAVNVDLGGSADVDFAVGHRGNGELYGVSCGITRCVLRAGVEHR